LLLALHLRRKLEASTGLHKGGLGRCCTREKDVKAWATWAAGKRKEEKKKWVGWGIWPKRVLGFKIPLYFLVFESNFEFKSNSIESYMNSNTKHLTIQNKMQAA
jgi:hypothetical protein